MNALPKAILAISITGALFLGLATCIWSVRLEPYLDEIQGEIHQLMEATRSNTVALSHLRATVRKLGESVDSAQQNSTGIRSDEREYQDAVPPDAETSEQPTEADGDEAPQGTSKYGTRDKWLPQFDLVMDDVFTKLDSRVAASSDPHEGEMVESFKQLLIELDNTWDKVYHLDAIQASDEQKQAARREVRRLMHEITQYAHQDRQRELAKVAIRFGISEPGEITVFCRSVEDALRKTQFDLSRLNVGGSFR